MHRGVALLALIGTALITLISEPAFAERRVALVIGNSQYKAVPRLNNPQRDAQALSDALRGLGFSEVMVRTELGRDQFISTLRDFAREADNADWAVVYYAGHGIEVGGVNYMIPIDAQLATDRDVEFEAIDLNKVMTSVASAGKLRVVILDACRDNPFLNQMKRAVGSRSIGRGLGPVEPEAGTLVVYAAKAGQLTADGDAGGNSPFMTALLARLPTPNLEVRRLFDLVRDDVWQRTRGQQQPFTYGSLPGSQDYYFPQTASAAVPQAPTSQPIARGGTICERLVDLAATAVTIKLANVEAALQACTAAVELAPSDGQLRQLLQAAQDQRAFRKAIDSRDRNMGEAYLALFPGGRYVDDVKQHLAALDAGVTAPPGPGKVDPQPQPDAKDLARVLQTELGRVGCNPGAPDGVWGPMSQQAMRMYNNHAKASLDANTPTLTALNDVRSHARADSP